MINPEQIPDKVVEAAAVTLMGRLMVSRQDALHVWSGMYEPEKDQFRREASVAIAAGLAAWPGVHRDVSGWNGFEFLNDYLKLPLPQETSDGK